MTGPRSYCDWNATAPILPDVAAAVTAALGLANPSSVHAEGRAARAAVEAARADVAALAGVAPSQVVFTSGGTEAAATALRPVSEDEVLFVGAAEHPCVRAGGGFAPDRIVVVPVDAEGRVDLAELAIAVGARGLPPGLVHVAIQAANNETGVINPADSIARCREAGWTVTVDAVQAAGRLPLAPYAAVADALILSAHKIGGPKGVGALIQRQDACGAVRPLIRGGGQERGLRSGTENVPGIVGFGVAARHARMAVERAGAVRLIRDHFERRLAEIAPESVVFSASAERICNTSLFAVDGLKAQTALIAFDLDQIAVSSGAACSSGKVAASPVLGAMGVSAERAASAIRVSFGPGSTIGDADRVIHSLERQLARLRTRRPTAA